MWTYFPGPFLAILPKRWRDALSFSRYVNWARATAISGVAEAVAALAVLSNWYSYAMSTWVGRGVDTALNGALSGKSGPEVRPQDIGGVALVVWVSHPLTWFIAYFGLEGALRLGTALTGTGCGTLPLFACDKVFLLLSGRRERSPLDEAAANGGLQATAGGVRELIAGAGRAVSDEICLKRQGAEEILEICASQKKDGWDPPRTVCYQDSYYRLESASIAGRPRPFRYVLRRLPAGVPGRSVLLYSPLDPVIREAR
jgi:hypothetical protein